MAKAKAAKPKVKNIRIAEVNIDPTAFKDAKTVADLKKSEVFSHLPEDEQQKAYSELLSSLSGKEESPTVSTASKEVSPTPKDK